WCQCRGPALSLLFHAADAPDLSTLSLHDALPISGGAATRCSDRREGSIPHPRRPHDRGIAGARRPGFRRGCHGRRSTSESGRDRSEEHTSELQSLTNLVCRLLLEKDKERLLDYCP